MDGDVLFFLPAGSSAYFTVSEIFSLEMRALAIAIFYSVGTAVGGIVAPWLFGRLINSGSRFDLFGGYIIAAGLMIAAVVVEIVFGIAAEQASLEKIAASLIGRLTLHSARVLSLLNPLGRGPAYADKGDNA